MIYSRRKGLYFSDYKINWQTFLQCKHFTLDGKVRHFNHCWK